MKRFWIDIETRSRCDLVKHGVYRYAADPSTEILIICFALDDGLIKTWHRGQALPPLLGGILAKPPRDVQLIAHNASFERHVLGRTFRAVLDPRHWYCTATQARASALAGSLDSASRMLGTKLSKNRRGAELIRLLSMPQADGSFNDDPVLLAEFAGYCRDDVAVMRELSKGLPPLTDEARALYTANELINDRGLPIDTELCTAALGYAERAAVEATARIQAVTAGAISKSRGTKLTQWIYERLRDPHKALMEVYRSDEKGLSLDASTREALLEAIDMQPDDFSVEVVNAIEAAEDAALSSISKFATMLDRVSSDGRLRGAFVQNGAAQTGRFSSTGAQLHNFPRLVADDPDALRQQLLRRDVLDGSVLTALKSMLRPAIRPTKGFIVRADWNAVEARGLPWLAGAPGAAYLETWRDERRDLYVEQAQLAGLGDHRQGGKVVVLSLGYGGGPNALLRMGKAYSVTIPDPVQVVRNWRAANSWAPEWWYALEGAAYTALRLRDSTWITAGRIKLAADAFGLAMELPSGRHLRYPFAEFEWQRDQSKITYLKAAWKPKANAPTWPRATMWHGTLAENATQATCGDLLRGAIVQSMVDGLPLIGHVHDELIGEAPTARAARDLARAMQSRMLALPSWARGLPLAVETDSAPYFRK